MGTEYIDKAEYAVMAHSVFTPERLYKREKEDKNIIQVKVLNLQAYARRVFYRWYLGQSVYKTSMYKIDGKPDIETVLFDLRALNISYADLT